MAIIIDKHDMELAYRMARDPGFEPCMTGAPMTVATYGALVDILDQAARGAAQSGDLRGAYQLDARMGAMVRIRDDANLVVAKSSREGYWFQDAAGGGNHEVG